ncbi:MAG: SnoaL-like domain-containing protein [Polyangiaceae bacterium]|nr:SnoaL-like domain-containing protein [Polyangiaceae bacterium]
MTTAKQESGTISRRKRILLEFYRLFYNEKSFEEGARLLSAGFVNHHPGADGIGPAGMVRDFSAAARHMPGFHIEARRLCEEGDYVWAHSIITGLPNGARVATVDIWRFEGDCIAEHWDVGQRLDPSVDASAVL